MSTTSRKVGYVTIGSASDVRAWSGLNAHILQALRDAGLEVAVADNLGAPRRFLSRLKGRIYRSFSNKTYSLDRDRAIALQWAQEAARRLSTQGDVPLVVSTGTIPIAQLPERYSTAIWADATFHSLRTTYPGYDKLCHDSVTSGEWLEKRAFDRSNLICFSSQWAATDAANYYGVPAHKLAVIPYGANCPPAYPDETAAIAGVRSRSRSLCRLVFVGVEWERKGGPLVLETARRLHDQGIPIRLSLMGCNPPPGTALPDYVENAGFLNKQVPADWEKWDTLMRSAHFLILPSIADCTPVALAEASAYALPSLARNVGGVSSVVRHGTNGLLFTPDADAGAYSDAIARLWQDPAAYEELALSSHREWTAHLRWDVAGKRFAERLTASMLCNA